MGNCRFCNQPAGFLRSKHSECAAKFERSSSSISTLALSALTSGKELAALKQESASIARDGLVDDRELKVRLVEAWRQAVDRFLEDGVLDEKEESRLVAYKEFFALHDSDLDYKGHLTKTVKAAVLRDLMEGKLPTRVSIEGNVALNLQKNEGIIWAFPNTEYLEDKTRRSYVGRSTGISVRIMKGVYYREGAFRGHPVEHTERVSYGKGVLVVTNKHIYFQGQGKSFRIPFAKIVSFEPYSNGIGVMRDAATAKPQLFINGDGWFIYNVVSNLGSVQ